MTLPRQGWEGSSDEGQRFIDGVRQLFREARESSDGSSNAGPRVELHKFDGWWEALPLEWNMAVRLAEFVGLPCRMVDAAGSVVREYRPAKVQAR